jgi:outer membrane protein OmpA-like peptidoglycan-associated protein
VDVSGGRRELPPTLESVRRRIEATRILFEIGSSSLSDDALQRLREVAAGFGVLHESVRSARAALRLLMNGRTDATGTDATNQSLAQWRIDQVKDRLSALGVPSDLLEGRALATSRPITDAPEVAASRVNRSVSFEVTIGYGASAPGGR